MKAAKVNAVLANPLKRLPVVKNPAVKTRLIKVDFFMVLHYTKGKVGY
nr:MAG TPA: hypothetical protein [Caudoviricetes sp.]